MTDPDRSKTLIIPGEIEYAPEPIKITTAVPAGTCYVVGQLCRGLTALASDPVSRVEANMDKVGAPDVHLGVRIDVLATCGRVCTTACRLPAVDIQARSMLEIPLDMNVEDLKILQMILNYLDKSFSTEERMYPHELAAVRDITNGYIGLVSDQARTNGAASFINPIATDGYCSVFGAFSGPNYRVIKAVTHTFLRASYEQQTNPDKISATLDDPLAIDVPDLRRYLLNCGKDVNLALNLSSTERSHMFDA